MAETYAVLEIDEAGPVGDEFHDTFAQARLVCAELNQDAEDARVPVLHRVFRLEEVNDA